MPFSTLRRIVLVLALLAYGIAPQVAHPQTAATSETLRFAYPLSKFAPRPGAVRLVDQSTGIDFSIPVSARIDVQAATLNLRVTSSLALSPQTSVLSVLFNGVTLGQVRLNATTPTSTIRVPVPPELIKPGFNQLTMSAVQFIGDECEDPESPALWSEIDTANSTIEITGRARNAPYRLSELDQVVTPGIGGVREVVILTPDGNGAPTHLDAGALAAQALALRTQYEPLAIRTATWQPAAPRAEGEDPFAAYADQDIVVLGTTAEITSSVPSYDSAALSGPRVGLRTLPSGRIRLFVSGRTEDELKTAAAGLALLDVPVTDAYDTLIRAIAADASRPAGGERAMRPDWKYRFDDLGLPTKVVQGAGIHEAFLDLPMPPDLYTHESAQVKLSLDFSYGADMGAGSVLNVTLNGKFMHGISLDNKAGGSFRGYEIYLPFRDFVPGANRLSFSIHMRIPNVGLCVGVKGRHLAMTLFGSSELTLPPASNVAAQPDLELFSRTAFPYFRPDQSTPVRIVVADKSLIGAGWMVAGRLAQVVRAPINGLTVTTGVSMKPGFAIILAPASALPGEMFQQVNFGVGRSNKVPYRSFNAPVGTPTPTLVEQAMEFIWGAPPSQVAARPSTGYVEQVNSLGRNGVMTAFASPGGNATTTLITAETAAQIDELVLKLISPGVWGQAKGDFMLWRVDNDEVTTLRMGPGFQLGQGDPMQGLRFYVSRNPWYWLFGTIGLLFVLSVFIVWVLARRVRKRDGAS
jgi:hypothetical protein